MGRRGDRVSRERRERDAVFDERLLERPRSWMLVGFERGLSTVGVLRRHDGQPGWLAQLGWSDTFDAEYVALTQLPDRLAGRAESLFASTYLLLSRPVILYRGSAGQRVLAAGDLYS